MKPKENNVYFNYFEKPEPITKTEIILIIFLVIFIIANIPISYLFLIMILLFLKDYLVQRLKAKEKKCKT
jgi:hypothetical protein